MKKMTNLMIGLFLIVLYACTPMIYGVPQETWNGMSEEQRTSTIQIYQERQLARQIAAEERARQHAIYLEEQQLKEQAEAEAMRYRVEAIYRGEGNYGDLLRVRIENGTANFRGQIRQYDPVAFQLAKGEIKDITIATTKNRRVVLHAYYDGATLYLDGNKNTKKSHMSKLIYDKRWSNGLTYSDVYTNNKAKLKGADVTVEVVGGKRHGNRYPSSGSTTIIIKEQPQTVIIKEKPPKVIVYDKSREATMQQRKRHDQLKKERYAIEKERKALEREQAEFEAEQLALKKERAELDKKRARIKKMKKAAARDKKKATQDKHQSVEEREQAVHEMEKDLEEKTQYVAKKEQDVAKKEQQVQKKEQHVKKQEKELEKEVEKIEKELEKEEKEGAKNDQENNGKKK